MDSSIAEIVEILAKDNFELFVILFHSGSDEESKVMKQTVNSLEKIHHRFKFIAILSEKGNELTEKYSIGKIPTCILIKHGSVIKKFEGLCPGPLAAEIRSLESSISCSIKHEDKDDKDLEALINKSPIMLFMKGTPEEPFCHFSQKIVKILDSTGVQYGSFDILTDEDVRQRLKQYSKWPTYPQLYVKGKLIGGLDIVQELVQSEELMDILKA